MATQGGSRKVLVVVACLAIGLPLLGYVLWGVMVGFEAEPTAEDRRLVLSVEDLLAFDPDIPNQPGKLTRTEYLDGSSMVEFEYETDALYVYASFNEERSEKDARAVYLGLVAAVPLMGHLEEGVDLVDRDELFDWGDQSLAKVFVYEGQPSGIVIAARRGRRVIDATVSGWAFEDAEQVDGLFGPWLERIPH